ncbi:MAG: GNAT family N-acetyltransferase [Planctomycetota bacterium]|nr:GNAT family N-acetyltransferase [Planctomycetota bacterium]
MSAESCSTAIRPARVEEASALSSLAMRSKASWGYDDDFMAACRKELTVSEAELQDRHAYVVENSLRVLGFYTLDPLCKDEVELGYLFIEPDAIGQGYGSRLMRHASDTAAALGYRAIIIQGDPHAETFYRAMGGKLIGHKPSESIPGRELPLFRIELE